MPVLSVALRVEHNDCRVGAALGVEDGRARSCCWAVEEHSWSSAGGPCHNGWLM